jgi:cohesin complex subunit SCC1
MFYSTQVLARKGPLGVVWLAAHMDGKLKKNNVFEANLVGSVGKHWSFSWSVN